MGIGSKMPKKKKNHAYSMFSVMQRLLLSSFYIVPASPLFPWHSFALEISPFKTVKNLTLGCKFSYSSSCLICIGPHPAG
jgi:hypothetical protein